MARADGRGGPRRRRSSCSRAAPSWKGRMGRSISALAKRQAEGLPVATSPAGSMIPASRPSSAMFSRPSRMSPRTAPQSRPCSALASARSVLSWRPVSHATRVSASISSRRARARARLGARWRLRWRRTVRAARTSTALTLLPPTSLSRSWRRVSTSGSSGTGSSGGRRRPSAPPGTNAECIHPPTSCARELAASRRTGRGAGQGLRPTPPKASTSAGSPSAASGRHRGHDTTPGSTSSRPSKKPAICSGLRGWYGIAPLSL